MSLTGNYYEQLQQEFLNDCENAEEGNISMLDLAVKFHEETSQLEELVEMRKDWIKENRHNIHSECEEYGKDGYKGLSFKAQTRTTYNFKNIPEWVILNDKIKALEKKHKNALEHRLVADENGEEIIYPTFTTSGFVKVDKIKSKN